MAAGKWIPAEYNLTNVQMAQLFAEQCLTNAPLLQESFYPVLQPGTASGHIHFGASRLTIA